jgi:hypothetical protein
MVSLKRWPALAAVVVVGALGLNCRDAMGPPPPASLAGRLAFVPTFASRSAGIVDFDRVRLTLLRQSRTVVLDTMIAISPTADSIDLLLSVQLSHLGRICSSICACSPPRATPCSEIPYPQTVTLTTSGGVAIVTTDRARRRIRCRSGGDYVAGYFGAVR